jgi:hypothetical protein
VSYKKWFQAHGDKHKKIMKKLTTLSDDEVIAYFRFENMVEKEPDFCPLYKENKKCHDIELLNCYLCACPNFRFDDEGISKKESKTIYSTCNIDSKDGDIFQTEEAIHQDCSGCLVPHQEAYIKKYFSRDWFEIMKKVHS